MIRVIAMFLIASVTCCCHAETNSIEGDWEVISYQEAGKNDPEGGGVGRTYRFTKKQITTVGEEEKEIYKYRVDPKKGHLDWYVQVGKLYLPMRSIYILQGDMLTISRAFPGKPRPKNFRSLLDQQAGVFVLRRMK